VKGKKEKMNRARSSVLKWKKNKPIKVNFHEPLKPIVWTTKDYMTIFVAELI